MQIRLNKLYVDRTLRTIHAAELRDDVISDDDYYCKILPVQIGRNNNSLSDTYSLTLKGTYYCSGSKEEKDAIAEISETIKARHHLLYALSDLFEPCWTSDNVKNKIRIKLGQEWFDATYEQNSLIHIDISSIQNRSIITNFNQKCDNKMSDKYDRLYRILDAKSN